jgi:hypothetical protein
MAASARAARTGTDESSWKWSQIDRQKPSSSDTDHRHRSS